MSFILSEYIEPFSACLIKSVCKIFDVKVTNTHCCSLDKNDPYLALADSGSTGHKNVPNIVSLSYCLEQLYSCIFNSYVKACLNIWWRRMYGLKHFFVYFLSACV